MRLKQRIWCLLTFLFPAPDTKLVIHLYNHATVSKNAKLTLNLMNHDETDRLTYIVGSKIFLI